VLVIFLLKRLINISCSNQWGIAYCKRWWTKASVCWLELYARKESRVTKGTIVDPWHQLNDNVDNVYINVWPITQSLSFKTIQW